MNWDIIDNKSRKQPKTGEYSDWKQQIADDCHNKCVYCSIHEQPWGGIDHYHIEHFRPKSKFKKLENVIQNLYHSCPVCNRFKSDDWQNIPTHLNRICYPNPSKFDYNTLFKPLQNDFILKGKSIAANYIINRLYLNRPQLILERREFYLNEKYNKLYDEVKKLVFTYNNLETYQKFIDIFSEIQIHLRKRKDIVPYKLSEIRKQND